MRTRLHKIEVALLPLPYRWMRSFYNSFDDLEKIEAHLQDLNNEQIRRLENFHKGFIELQKRRGAVFLDEKESGKQTNARANSESIE